MGSPSSLSVEVLAPNDAFLSNGGSLIYFVTINEWIGMWHD